MINDNVWETKISNETVENAIKLGNALITHARKVYNIIDENIEISHAKYVLKRIIKGKQLEQSGKLSKNKDILDTAILLELCKGKTFIQKPSDLKAPLKLLRELNFIRIIKRKSEGPGRNPSPIIKLNPKAFDIFDKIDK